MSVGWGDQVESRGGCVTRQENFVGGGDTSESFCDVFLKRNLVVGQNLIVTEADMEKPGFGGF